MLSFTTILIGTRIITDAGGKEGELFDNFYFPNGAGAYQEIVPAIGITPPTGTAYRLRVALVHGIGTIRNSSGQVRQAWPAELVQNGDEPDGLLQTFLS